MRPQKLLRLLALLLMTVVVGCASAYHSYSGCYVDCKYCAPPPLPYTHYEECVCHPCAASPYSNKWSQSVSQENRAVQPAESRDGQASSP